jgi:hypothetical protein
MGAERGFEALWCQVDTGRTFVRFLTSFPSNDPFGS